MPAMTLLTWAWLVKHLAVGYLHQVFNIDFMAQNIIFDFADTPQNLPFIVKRSRMNNLPVYLQQKAGRGTLTYIKKIDGDVEVNNKSNLITKLTTISPN